MKSPFSRKNRESQDTRAENILNMSKMQNSAEGFIEDEPRDGDQNDPRVQHGDTNVKSSTSSQKSAYRKKSVLRSSMVNDLHTLANSKNNTQIDNKLIGVSSGHESDSSDGDSVSKTNGLEKSSAADFTNSNIGMVKHISFE